MIILGVDGGGSKTEAVIMDDGLRVLGTGMAGPSNTSFIPHETAVNAFRDAISQAMKEAGVRASDIDVTGSTFAVGIRDALAELGISAPFHRISEGHVAFERAGLQERRGVVVVAGTGCSIWGMNAEREYCIGGWGAVLGDDGSAYDIGRRGIRRAFMAVDGRCPATKLTDAVLEYFGVRKIWDVIGRLLGTQVNQSLIAGFARRVGELAAAGDEAALEIVEQVGEELGEMAAFVARQVFDAEDEFPFVLSGGVFNLGSLIIDPFRAVVTPQFVQARIITARMRPGEAAARLLLRRMKGEVKLVDD